MFDPNCANSGFSPSTPKDYEDPYENYSNFESYEEITYETAKDHQVGGNHYTKYDIQPLEYSMRNGLDACQHTIIKYVTRFRDKNGREDLEKAKHTIDYLIEMEYGE